MRKRSILRAAFIGEVSGRRVVLSIILIPICVVLGLFIIANSFADRVIFQPQASSYSDTGEIIKLTTGQGDQISAKYYESPQGAYTLLFSHGNADDIGMVEPLAWRLRDLGDRKSVV